MPVQKSTPLPGTTSQLGKYELLRRLAVGGMGEIFLARQRGMAGFDRLVVVKQLLPELARSPELVSMFIDEARILAHLAHPNLVHVHEFGSAGGAFFLAMEYVPGENLARLCMELTAHGQELARPLAVHIVAEMARGLDFAHGARDPEGKPLGIVHRDVSPHNVLVSAHGDVKLMDFGIAKARNKLHQTEAGVLRGKFAYMSPEQADGIEVDARSDVFAAGVMLWELTLMKRLFRGDSDIATMKLVREMPVPRPSEVDPTYPLELEAIVMGALERDRGKRTQTAGELATGLRNFLATAGWRVEKEELGAIVCRLFPEADAMTAPGASQPPDDTHGATRQLAQMTPPASPQLAMHGTSAQVRRRRWLLVGLVLALGSTLGLAAILGGGGGDGDRDGRQAAATVPSVDAAASAPFDAGTVLVAVVENADAAPGPTQAADAGALKASRPTTPKRPPVKNPKNPVASGTPDAGPALVAKEPPPDPPRAPEPGTLSVSHDEELAWGTVAVNNVRKGQTPVRMELAPGTHLVELTISSGGATYRARATVESGKTTKCRAHAEALECDSPR